MCLLIMFILVADKVYKYFYICERKNYSVKRLQKQDDDEDKSRRVRASSVHDHFGIHHFGTEFSTHLKSGPSVHDYSSDVP